MNLDQKPWIFLWRPFYRSFVLSTIWPFLHRLKEFFLRETLEELGSIMRQQNELTDRIIPLENRLNRISYEVGQGVVESVGGLIGEHQRRVAIREEQLRNEIAQRITAMESRINALPQEMRQFIEVPAKLISERQQQWANLDCLLRNELNPRIAALGAELKQVRQEFAQELAKRAEEHQQQWAALEELLLNILNQPFEYHCSERDDRCEASGH